MAGMTPDQHTVDQTAGTLLSRQHRLGPLPRILTGVAFAVAVGGSIWSANRADPSIGFDPSMAVVVLLILGAITAGSANPKQDKMPVIIGIWAMVVAYIGIVVGGAMVGITEALAPHLAPPGWGDPWHGLGVRIGFGSFFLWVLVTILTLLVAALQQRPFESDADYWRHGPSR